VRLIFKTWGLVEHDTIQDLTHQPFLVLGDCFECPSSWKRMEVRESLCNADSQTTFGVLTINEDGDMLNTELLKSG